MARRDGSVSRATRLPWPMLWTARSARPRRSAKRSEKQPARWSKNATHSSATARRSHASSSRQQVAHRLRPIPMSLPASERTRWALVVAVGALLLAALNLWWVMRFREGYPFDIDEAGYTVFGLIDYFGLRDNGLEGWWSAIQNQPTFAPLVPALTSFLVYVDPGVMNGFMVLTAFLVVLTMAIYGIGAQLAGPRLGAFAALVTATMPGAFAFSREYVYALPTAALLACAIYALIRSDGLRLRRGAGIDAPGADDGDRLRPRRLGGGTGRGICKGPRPPHQPLRQPGPSGGH